MEDLLVEPTTLPQISPYKSQISYRAARAASSSDRNSREEAIEASAEGKRNEAISAASSKTRSSQSADAKTSSWGRLSVPSWLGAAGCGAIIMLCPTLVIFIWIALEHHQGSLFNAAFSVWENGFFGFVEKFAPVATLNATLGYLGWLAFQAVLFTFLPGQLSIGQLTPAGHLLKYTTNGLLAWVVTHVTAVALVYADLLDPALIAKQWGALLVAVNVCGFLLSKFAYSKLKMPPLAAPNSFISKHVTMGRMIWELWMICGFPALLQNWH